MKDNCLLTANECLAFTENFIHKFNGDFSQAVEKEKLKSKDREKDNKSMGNTEKMVKRVTA